MGLFKEGELKILIATDIAARGIDVSGLALVVNYDLPNIPETYVHRIGRTGRAKASGVALSFCDVEEKEYLRDIEKLICTKIPVEKEHPFLSNEVAQDSSLVKTHFPAKNKSRQQQFRRRR